MPSRSTEPGRQSGHRETISFGNALPFAFVWFRDELRQRFSDILPVPWAAWSCPLTGPGSTRVNTVPLGEPGDGLQHAVARLHTTAHRRRVYGERLVLYDHVWLSLNGRRLLQPSRNIFFRRRQRRVWPCGASSAFRSTSVGSQYNVTEPFSVYFIQRAELDQHGIEIHEVPGRTIASSQREFTASRSVDATTNFNGPWV